MTSATTSTMTAGTHELVPDEMQFFRRVVPVQKPRLLELGCGKADMACRLLETGAVQSVTALEVDEAQLAQNMADPRRAGITFIKAGAEGVPLPDASHDVAMMLKSLHHVPLDSL